MGAIEDLGFGGSGMGSPLPAGVGEGIGGDGFVIDELIDLEVEALSEAGNPPKYRGDAHETAKNLLSQQMKGSADEQAMVDYIADWIVTDGGAQTPQDVLRKIMELDGHSSKHAGKTSQMLARMYQEVLRNRLANQPRQRENWHHMVRSA